MPTRIIRLIPNDPTYVPDDAQQELGKALFSSFVIRADQVTATATDEIRFIDPGENWRGVTCPACGTNLSEWWQQAAEVAYQNGFTDLTVQVPCCGAEGSLNDLNYDPAAGFARFVLEAVNPQNNIQEKHFIALQKVFGCDLRLIDARYSE